MKYTITLTAEDLAFTHDMPNEILSPLIRAIQSKLNGEEIDCFNEIAEPWKKLQPLFRPVKNSTLGTAEMCQLCADRLNGLLGTKFKPNAQSMKTHVSARLKEGYTQEDFLLVIDKKVSEWASDDRMRQYLRPETLFGTKFEGYLNQPHVVDGKVTISTDYSQADYSEGL